MYDKVTAELGVPSSGNSNYTMKLWKSLGDVKCGISCEHINSIPFNSKFKSVINEFASMGSGCLDDVQVGKIVIHGENEC